MKSKRIEHFTKTNVLSVEQKKKIKGGTNGPGSRVGEVVDPPPG